ncbi:DNA binding [Microdochium nivale]|nr:DNA binding [Microdochium nivale]
MKRHADGTPAPVQTARRQPQTSCDSCRQKKLKCDRAYPCASCQVRGLPCSLSPLLGQDESLEGVSDVASILGRLATLEQAVFDRTPASQAEEDVPAYFVRPRHRPVTDGEREGHKIASFLDVAYFRPENGSTGSGPHLDVRITTRGYEELLASRPSSCCGPVWLPPHEDAIAMLHDFVENAYHIMPIVHLASARSIFDHIYSQLGIDDMGKIHPAHISMLLGICAASALFWNEAVSSHHQFESDQVANCASLVWNKLAIDLLRQSQTSGTRSLQGAQASAILAYLAYNIHGSSTQFYHLHNYSVTTCRDLQIHLVDSRGYDSPNDDATTREIKRRLWWHVTATDWMLGLNGGPLDGTYTIHPRQFKVAMPRNLNDIDLAINSDEIVYPSHIATQTSCFLQAIRLAEISRTIVDSSCSNDGIIIDEAYSERVLALDELFSKALANLPRPLNLTCPISEDAPRYLCLQRATVHLGFHSRRARLHRPFLVHKNSSKGQQQAAATETFKESRDICVRSARIVLDISMSLLGRSLSLRKIPSDSGSSQVPQRLSLLHHDGHENCPSFPVHRLGVVVNHLFWACAILAFEFSLRTHNSGTDNDNDLRHTLIHACRLLTAAGEGSTVAAEIVRGMRSVYDKYRICGVDEVAWMASEQHTVATGSLVSLASQAQIPASQGFSWPAIALNDDSAVLANGSHTTTDSTGILSSCETFGLDRGDLDNFFVSSYACDGWDQIISGFDGYCNP